MAGGRALRHPGADASPARPPARPPGQVLLDHRNRGRNRRTALALGAVWTGLALMVWVIDAAGWVVAGLGLFSLPALWDLLSDRPAGLRLGADGLTWHSGAGGGTIPLSQIRAVRLDRRLDLSHRVSVVLQDQRLVRLPQDCLPPLPVLEAALRQAGLRVERHPFAVI
jgi:hypothetical protein